MRNARLIFALALIAGTGLAACASNPSSPPATAAVESPLAQASGSNLVYLDPATRAEIPTRITRAAPGATLVSTAATPTTYVDAAGRVLLRTGSNVGAFSPHNHLLPAEGTPLTPGLSWGGEYTVTGRTDGGDQRWQRSCQVVGPERVNVRDGYLDTTKVRCGLLRVDTPAASPVTEENWYLPDRTLVRVVTQWRGGGSERLLVRRN